MNTNDRWVGAAARIFCLCAFAASIYFLLKHLASPLLALLAVFFVSWGISRTAKRLAKMTGISQGIWAFLMVSGIVLFMGLALFYVCRHILSEIKQIVDSIGNGALYSLFHTIEITDSIPFLSELLPVSEDYAADIFGTWIAEVAGALGGMIRSFISRMAKATPSVLITAVTAVISLFYLSIDFDGACDFFKSLLPTKIQKTVLKLKDGMLFVCVKLIRAYLLIFIITFAELLIGLSIICPAYACFGALAIAAIDILPLFGAGAVLVPWAILSLAQGNTAVGIGLLVLYAAVAIVRRIIEPKIIGNSMGIHPIGSILSMLIGFRLLGFFGLLAAPCALCAALKIKQNR